MAKSYVIAGGDMRFSALAAYFAERNRVYTVGFDRNTIVGDAENSGIIRLGGISSVPERADYLVLPLPASQDGTTLSTPYYSGTISLKTLCSAVSENGIVFGGRLTPDIEEIFTSRGIEIIDYSTREEFSVMNAVATAEGALQLALEDQPTTLSGSDCLILGMGRISKALIRLLGGFGMRITVAARKCSDRAWANVFGCKAVDINEIESSGALEAADVIFNTVPAMILTRNRLTLVKRNCLMIDLASKPGGMDFDAASALGLRAIWALSLPGKTAPVTAGRVIAKTIEGILHERSVKG